MVNDLKFHTKSAHSLAKKRDKILLLVPKLTFLSNSSLLKPFLRSIKLSYKMCKLTQTWVKFEIIHHIRS